MPYVSPRDWLPKYRIPFPSGVGLHAGSVLHAFKTWEGEGETESVSRHAGCFTLSEGEPPGPGSSQGSCAVPQPSLPHRAPPYQQMCQSRWQNRLQPAACTERKTFLDDYCCLLPRTKVPLKITCFAWAGSKCCLRTGRESHGFMSSFHAELVLTNQR